MKLTDFSPKLSLAYLLLLSQGFWSNQVVSQSVEEKTKDNDKWTSRTNLICEDHPIKCDFYWSRGWFTCNNGGALWEHCPKSCGFCGDTPDCTDKRTSRCAWFKSKGYCTNGRYKNYMQGYCAKTCELCEAPKKPKLEPGCKDYEDMCSKWVKYGDCRKSADVRKFCPKSCRICGNVPTKKPSSLKPRVCEDENPIVCKQKYLCARKQSIASKQCRKTCQMCGKSGSCYDLDSLCYWYKHQGHCKPNSYYYNHVSSRCAYSCGICSS